MREPEAPEASGWITYKRLLRWILPYRLLLGLAFVGMIIEAAAAGAFTSLMQPMIDKTLVSQNDAARWELPLVIVGIFVLRGIATFITDYGMARAGRSVVRDLRVAVLDKMLRLPSARFDREPVASLVSRLNFDTEQVAQASTEALKVLITDTLTVIALVGVMLWHSPTVTAAIAVIVPLIAVIAAYVSGRYRRLNRRIQEGVGELATGAEEILAGQQDIKVYGRQPAEVARYRLLANANLLLNMKVESTRAGASSVIQLLGAIALAVLLGVASMEASKGRLSAGAFVAIMTSMMVLIPSLKRLANVQALVQRGIAASVRLFGLLDELQESDHGTHAPERARGVVLFEAVGLRYPGAEQSALDGVSLRAEPGTVTAIVGRSGSGKTTLARLLPRFYEPSEGRITLDGVPLGDWSLPALRRQIALVGQKVMLFDDSVAANIAYGAAGEASPEAIRAAADAANASEFIDRLPEGMATRIGENGNRLSGGQRQRIAIARAVLKDAPILVLDEATAALDNESERLVQAALERLIPNHTTFVIAHRLSTIERADQVLVMESGRIVEAGTHAELLAHGGLYAQLHRAQFRDA
ncbi:lipid A export permease/ATP-binding protein MsbA [Silanimonas sp.]|uniref:lipid A export permease/ATP-binding protein MsbA n=1 Tax=Silanimonas sp. TaxID=1929290 RepID=UPI0022C4E399|nr:lipid A export permease/ATP-binding protein MsbA [Silanimonas sp.]MCZ8113460.1 lipid A export permease/ATP-binding protein MsbA [Silanimonas sp.]